MKRIRNLHNSSNDIVEINTIKTVLDYAQYQDSLVVFDVDKTLAYTDQEFGSEPWAFWLVKQKLSQGRMLSEAFSCMFDLYKLAHDHIELKPVEPETVAVVHQLGERSIPTIVLTGRPCSMADRTYEQLRNLGIVVMCPQEFNQILNLGISETASLHKGVVCVGMADKGSAFLQVMQKINYNKPSSLIFVDDKKDCVDSLSLICKRKNIPFTGLRYGFLDGKEEYFDEQKAQEHLDEFLSKISIKSH